MIAIVDYQMGNLRSVQKAFERTGHAATITSDPDEVARASKIVLPGVGAFCNAIAEVRSRGLAEPIVESIRAGKPFLGICLGLQMLFEVSLEDGEHQGLGVFPGQVVRFENLPPEIKIPHMGWNTLNMVRRPPIFEGIDTDAHFYFVHSYYVVPSDESIVGATTDYPTPFCSMIWHENVYATQFHPEKSQRNGLQLLRNFAAL